MVRRTGRSVDGVSEPTDEVERMLNIVHSILFWAGLTAVAGVAQSPDIVERAAANDGRPLTITISQDAYPISIEALAAGSELALEGKLIPLQSYLSEDKRHILSDYEIQPGRVFIDRKTSFSRAAPGPANRLTLTLYGGQVEIEGTSVTLVDRSFSKRPAAGRYLMFLVEKPNARNAFQLFGGAAGLFAINGKDVVTSLRRQLQKGDESDVSDIPLERLFERIVASAKR